MRKELDPKLFTNDESQGLDFAPDGRGYNQASMHSQTQFEEIKQLTEAFLELKKKISQLPQLEKYLYSLETKWEQSTRELHKRDESLTHRLGQLEKSLSDQSHDLQNRILALRGQVKGNLQLDEKIQGMIERHQEITRAFEIKLQQMQKLTQQQELKLMNAMSALEDARHEIALLKKL